MTRWLSLPSLVLLTGAALLPLWGPMMPRIEGRVLPVTSHWGMEPIETQGGREGARFYLRFTKLRDCDLVNYSFIHRETLVRANVEAEYGYTVVTLPAGEEHRTGPFIAWGVSDITDYTAVTVHRCHPFWLTISEVYP